MIARGARDVGRFSVEFTVANFGDIELARRNLLDPNKVRRLTLSGVVDSGAVRLVLPLAVVKQLGMPMAEKIIVRHANGQTAERHRVHGVHVELLGRDGEFAAIVEPRRRDALIGAIVPEDLDLLVDCANQRLVPRDPKGPIYEA
jgi:predicted aspartyl protease